MEDALTREIHAISKDVAIIKERQENHIEQSRVEHEGIVERVESLEKDVAGLLREHAGIREQMKVLESLEKDLAGLLREHAGIRGQMKMLSILGGILVGVAVIAEVVILVMK